MGTLSDFLTIIKGTQTNIDGALTGENGKIKGVKIGGADNDSIVTHEELIEAIGTIPTVGTIIDGTLSESLSMPNQTTTLLGTVIVPKGVWLIVGQVRLNTSAESGTLRIWIESPSGTTAGMTYAPAALQGAAQAVCVFSRTSQGTFTMKARQDTGASNSASTYTYLIAVKIG